MSVYVCIEVVKYQRFSNTIRIRSRDLTKMFFFFVSFIINSNQSEIWFNKSHFFMFFGVLALSLRNIMIFTKAYFVSHITSSPRNDRQVKEILDYWNNFHTYSTLRFLYKNTKKFLNHLNNCLYKAIQAFRNRLNKTSVLTLAAEYHAYDNLNRTLCIYDKLC